MSRAERGNILDRIRPPQTEQKKDKDTIHKLARKLNKKGGFDKIKVNVYRDGKKRTVEEEVKLIEITSQRIPYPATQSENGAPQPSEPSYKFFVTPKGHLLVNVMQDPSYNELHLINMTRVIEPPKNYDNLFSDTRRQLEERLAGGKAPSQTEEVTVLDNTQAA